jgi:hypothetical protein
MMNAIKRYFLQKISITALLTSWVLLAICFALCLVLPSIILWPSILILWAVGLTYRITVRGQKAKKADDTGKPVTPEKGG